MKKEDKSNKPFRTKGEPFVWITGMGLAVGLMMVLGLILLIAANGLAVFWPKPVAEVVLKEEEAFRFRNGTVLAGIIKMDREMDPRDLTPEQIHAENPMDRREIQLFTGNRDVYGQPFVFVPSKMIAEIRHPQSIILAKRWQHGDAVFYPVRLTLADGSVVAADDPQFNRILDRQVAETRKRMDAIEALERKQMGPINLAMRDLEIDLRHLKKLRERTPAQDRELAELEEELEELKAKFLPLEEEARRLRTGNKLGTLTVRLATGEERTHPVGDIVYFYYPNNLTFLQKLGLFFSQLWEFLSEYPREANTEGGIFPAIFGTFVMTLLMSIAVTPFGVVAAIYLHEYARQGFLVRCVRIAINNLAGVPSIVFGVFGLGFFVLFLGSRVDSLFFPRAAEANVPVFGTGGVLWASLTLAMMTVPVVIVATEEALAAVSRGVREGSLACGASKWQTLQNLVLPASLPGILTGLILAMARGAGEVAPLMLVGVVAFAPNLPLDSTFPFIHLERKFMHLGFHIYDLGFQSPDSEAALPMVFATTLVLILLVILLNLAAILIRSRVRKKYAAGSF